MRPGDLGPSDGNINKEQKATWGVLVSYLITENEVENWWHDWQKWQSGRGTGLKVMIVVGSVWTCWI
jgi:hypothetical protein